MAADDDPVREAMDELYSIDPDEFMQRRKDLAAGAKQAGATTAAKQIAALRKPTRSAYTVNRLARADPDAVADLVELGGLLRQAERSVDPAQIRELTGRRRTLVNELTRRALQIVGEDAPSSALRDEVVSTLTAALADDAVATQLADGTLVKPARWEGFGFGGAPDLKVVPTPARSAAPSRPRAGSATTSAAGKKLSPAERADARRRDEQEAAEQQAAAKAAAEEAKQRRVQDARQAVDDAEEAVILATDEEQTRLERLRLLEEQVTDARRAVDEARVQLRRAEIRQRRARDALGRLER